MKKEVDAAVMKMMLSAEESEITEHNIYRKLSESIKDTHNSKVLKSISDDEFRHYNFWKSMTGVDVPQSKLRFWKYYLISKVFGITFGTKLMERGEGAAQQKYDKLAEHVPHAKQIEADEKKHEKLLLDMLDEEKLKYVGSIVLGLNDALVELTGALAGFTLAFKNSNIIAIAGLITGIAASFSMGASEYLSTKSEKGDGKNPFKASIYTTLAYILTVFFLVFPFMIMSNPLIALAITLVNVMIVITTFTFYISVAQDISFRSRFTEMTLISLGVAAFSFGVGFIIRTVWGIEI